jgi:hypothetical protein
MHFPLTEQLGIICCFEQQIPGQLHPDGRRYLPQILLRPIRGSILLGIVDRHHRVALSDEGKTGRARLVASLGSVRSQRPPYRLGILSESASQSGITFMPTLLGHVHEVATLEAGSALLSSPSTYVELSLNIGVGLIGLRTNLSTTDFPGGSLAPGSFLELVRTRIDILEFVPQ